MSEHLHTLITQLFDWLVPPMLRVALKMVGGQEGETEVAHGAALHFIATNAPIYYLPVIRGLA